ncbi:Cell Cycle Progression Protein 1 [Manis pentadactyla]|nr:Cell Cycle Progression Protein 1 [Manis pentadactyla]
MTDIEADGVGSETLALRKELGSGSDVTWAQDVGTGLWVRFPLKELHDTFMERIFVQFCCECDGAIEAQAMVARLSFICLRHGMTDIEADGVGSETLALRKELGSGSDVTGSARCWNRFMERIFVQLLMERMVRLRLRETMRLWFQDYSEARVISKVMVEFQETVGSNVEGRVSSPGLVV